MSDNNLGIQDERMTALRHEGTQQVVLGLRGCHADCTFRLDHSAGAQMLPLLLQHRPVHLHVQAESLQRDRGGGGETERDREKSREREREKERERKRALPGSVESLTCNGQLHSGKAVGWAKGMLRFHVTFSVTPSPDVDDVDWDLDFAGLWEGGWEARDVESFGMSLGEFVSVSDKKHRGDTRCCQNHWTPYKSWCLAMRLCAGASA